MAYRIANIAASLAEHTANHDWHGYDQIHRNGDGEGVCPVVVDGKTYYIQQGDRDCSSMVIECWQVALQGTAYDGALDRATYTGNMRRAFMDSGLFTWHPMGDGYVAQRGDIYLNERDHTAICVSAVPDMLAEASINEHGGITGGQTGDQTGREIRIGVYYDYPWDGILAYNGKADTGSTPAAPAAEPRIRVCTREHGWLEWVTRAGCEDGCGDGYAGVPGCWIYGIEAENCGTVIAEHADGTKDNGQCGSSPITGIHLTGDVSYQAHWLGSNPGWGKVEHADDDDGAGKDANSPLDMIRLV